MYVGEADLEYSESELGVDIHDRHICCCLLAALGHRERENVLRATEACRDSTEEKTVTGEGRAGESRRRHRITS